MKAICLLAVVVPLVLAVSQPAPAMISFSYLEPTKAKEMGVKVEAKGGGPDGVWIGITFDVKGALKHYSPETRFSRVELRIEGTGQGENKQTPLMTAGLLNNSREPDRVSVSFTAERSQLDKFEVWIIIGGGLFDGGAYVMKMEEYVSMEKPAPKKKPAPKPKPDGDAPPAAPADLKE